jgi:hypothetical protein
MNKKCLETKTFTKENMQKSTTFRKERLLFLFNFSKISCSKHKGIFLNLRATYALNSLQKLMKKDFFLAIDATTQSSNKEANEKEMIFYLFKCLNEETEGKCRQAQNQ